MKTNIINGENVSTLNWDYFVTLIRFIPTSITQWEKQINRIMDQYNFNQIYWTCEKTKKMNGTYHSHLLLDTNYTTCTEQDLVSNFSNYIVKGKEIFYNSTFTTNTSINNIKEVDGKKIIFDITSNQNKRLIEYKTTRTLRGANKQIIKQEVIAKELIPFHEVQGQDGRVYIEQIKGVKNASIYMNKFTERGITTGYLKK
jgi:hypothetical protein